MTADGLTRAWTAAPPDGFRYAILGPIELQAGSVRGLQPRLVALLADLLIHANETVSTHRLIDDVWDGELGGAKREQMAVSRLRKALPGLEVERVGDGYQLAVQPSELDAEVFRSRVADGRHAFAARQLAEAARLLREAEELWRGAALEQVRGQAFAQDAIRSLEEERESAFELRVQAELDLGQHEALCDELAARLRHQAIPNERLAEHLMLAYYRSDRQQQALEVYREVRVKLDEALALEPGPGLKALHAQILNQSGALALAPASARLHRRTWPLPLPAVLAAPAEARVGRARERARLREIVRAVQGGARHAVWICGEPGMGKTSLIADIARHAREDVAFSVAYGAPAGEIGVPYGPWAGALSHLVKHAAYEPLAAHVAAHDAELARLVPALLDQLKPLPPPRRSHPEAERSLLFSAVVGWLEALCEAGPVALVLDDLHWADVPSLTLLEHVLNATSQLPLLLLLGYRHTELTPALREMVERGREGVHSIRLSGLTVADVAQLMTRGEGALSVDGVRVAERIATETGGNPFELGEVLRPLYESGAIAQDHQGVWHVSLADVAPSEGVSAVVNRRVRRLGELPERVLRSGAVIGLSFDLDLLERLVGVPEDELLEALETAEAGELIVDREGIAGQFTFAHALIHKAVYQSLTRTRKARMHLRVATTLELLEPARRDTRVAELAHHWHEAGADEHAGKVRHYAGLAGQRALDQLAPEEAVRWFRRAVELLPRASDERERCDLLTRLGEAKRRAGDTHFGVNLVKAARIAERVGDHERLSQAALANTLGPFGAAGPMEHQRVAMLELALDQEPPDSPSRPRLLATLARELYFGGDPGRGAHVSERARAVADRVSDVRRRADVLALLTATHPIAPLAEFAALVEEATGYARRVDDPQLRFCAAHAEFMYGMHTGDPGPIDRGLAELRRLDPQLGEPLLHWQVVWACSARATLAGDLHAGEALAREAAAEAREHGRRQGALIAFGQLLSAYTEWCRLDELREPLDGLIAANPAMPVLRLARGFIDAETGQLAPAAAVLAVAERLEFAFPFDRTLAFNLARCADIALRVGARDTGETLYRRLMPYRQHFATVSGISSRGSIELALGRLATMARRFTDADAHLGRAEAAHDRLGAPILQARTALARTELLSACGRREEADVQLARALQLGHASAAVVREVELAR